MEHIEYNKLGNVIKEARTVKNLSREQLAESVNITPRYLMAIENENKKPSFDVLFSLIRKLGIPADTIFYTNSANPNIEVEQTIRLLYLCNERDLKVAMATIKALLDSKQDQKIE